jgi:cyclase
MHTNLIVARMDAGSSDEVAKIFGAFDQTDMPQRMGTRRRQLFKFQGLYFHLQEFDDDLGSTRIEGAKTNPRFVGISEALKPFIDPYDPQTWRSPADAMASRFYSWEAK